MAANMPDGVEIVGQVFRVVDWPAYIAWAKASGKFNLPRVRI